MNTAVLEAPLAEGEAVANEISPAGARVLPFRSNIPKLTEFTFIPIDQDYPRRAAELAQGSGHFVISVLPATARWPLGKGRT